MQLMIFLMSFMAQSKRVSGECVSGTVFVLTQFVAGIDVAEGVRFVVEGSDVHGLQASSLGQCVQTNVVQTWRPALRPGPLNGAGFQDPTKPLDSPKYGRVKVNRILTHCRISPSKTIGGLSERQRNELVRLLRR